MRYFLYRITLLGAFHWKPKNFAFFEYKGGIAGPHCCLHAHHVLWPSVSFHHRTEHCKWYYINDFFLRSSNTLWRLRKLLKHPETEEQSPGFVLCFVRHRGGKDPTDEVGAVELGLGNPCRWHRHRCSVEHPGAVMTSEVEWKLWSMSPRLTKGFLSLLSATSFAEQSFFVLFYCHLTETITRMFSRWQLQRIAGIWRTDMQEISWWRLHAMRCQDFPRHLSENYITRARFDGGQFSEPIMWDLSCGKIHDRFKNWFSVNLCALNLLSLQILLFGSPLRSWCFILHFPEMHFTFQVS